MTRLSSSQAAALIGKSVRWVQINARNGTIPGAAVIGGTYSFDADQIKRWIRTKEIELCQKTCFSETGYGGRALPSMAGTLKEAYEQALNQKHAQG